MNRSASTALAVVLTALLAPAALGQDRERSIGVSVQRYTPRLDSARDVYGSATATSFTYEYLSEKSSFVRAGVGFLKHSGNGYGRHFVDGPLATQSLMPFELSVGYRAALSDEGVSGEAWLESGRHGEDMARQVAEIPMARAAAAEDIAKTAAFLASSESDYLSGIAITVAGGSELL